VKNLSNLFIIKKMKNQKNESRVIVENGEVKTIFSEEIENNGGWMTIDEMCDLLLQSLTKTEELLNQQNEKNN
jgi:3-deoxy-D-manno-octulosonate 8-phosphate phosphatase KdsC-like HAD superfamily phosphatase